jgi:hypothetical protein
MNTQERLKQRAQEEWDRKPHLHGCFSCFEAFSWAFCCGVIVYRDEVRKHIAAVVADLGVEGRRSKVESPDLMTL